VLRGSLSEDTKGTCIGISFYRGEGAPKRRLVPHFEGVCTLRERAQDSREIYKGFLSFKWVKNQRILVVNTSS
jgi:hypothetical protein